jgi:hypothetical protein
LWSGFPDNRNVDKFPFAGKIPSCSKRKFKSPMLSTARRSASPQHDAAVSFIRSLAGRSDVAICELVLVELYLKLRNEKISSKPLTAASAAKVCQSYRNNRSWRLIESAPIMSTVWEQAAQNQFVFRRIIMSGLPSRSVHTGLTSLQTPTYTTLEIRGLKNSGTLSHDELGPSKEIRP